METWRDILGYEGQYMVSDQGRIKSLERKVKYSHGERTIPEQIKKTDNLRGYQKVLLWNGGVSKHYQVHRLVAQAFIPNPDNLPQVNHKDENPSNNTVENLEWCSAKYNCNYGTAIKRRAEKQGKPILCVELNKVFLSVGEAERWIGKDNAQRNLWLCCNKKRKTAYGYHWQYVGDENEEN